MRAIMACEKIFFNSKEHCSFRRTELCQIKGRTLTYQNHCAIVAHALHSVRQNEIAVTPTRMFPMNMTTRYIKWIESIIGLSLIAAFTCAAFTRNYAWHDEVTLLEDTTNKARHKGRMYINLGIAYQNKNRIMEAIHAFQSAASLAPDNFGIQTTAHCTLGLLYSQIGLLNDSVLEYQATLRIKPDHEDAHNNLGVVYQRLGRFADAFNEYQTVLKLNPNHVEAHNNLGNLYIAKNLPYEAAREYQAALQLDPNFINAQQNLKQLLETTSFPEKQY